MSKHANIQQSNPPGAGVSNWNNDMNDDDDNEDLLLLNDSLNLNTSSLRSDEKYTGFDNNSADTWIFPSNFPERAYQFNIIQKALFHNTLVVLPTGLGKTFIAAVVMYNIYRWYPMGKVIFMAPTRPLVAQQIDACCKIMGIPKQDSVEITGKLSKANRAQLWQSKRVFFATPQSVQSDIFDAELNFPFQAVKLIVVDEAHRAKGKYAYTEVIRYIWSKNKYFRILALSATPGRRKEDVEEVIRNLFISNLEVRTEDSVDVVSYVHKRQLKVVVVDLGTKLSQIRDELLEIADPHIRNLIENRLISGRPGSISRNWLVMEHKRFREMTLNNGVPYQKELNSDFSICISVYHAIELLERHGLRVFLNNFDETQENGPKFVVILRPDLRRLIQRVREEAGPNPFAFSDQCMLDGEIATIPPNIDFGHPKFEIAREHVVAHFESNKDARVIIFCEYRESVMLMHRLLLQHRPVIRPRLFVGQGGSGSIRAVTQQQQISVMNDFKSGKSNALIATSVAEEGIDVGEVDLIVCFDINTSNPTRFIQRIGRTGRKKEGKVLLLATEGKEHSMLKDVLSERNRLNKSISKGGQFNSAFYNQAPRMVPTEFNPKCLKVFIQPQESEEPKSKDKPAKTIKGNKFAQICQKKDLRHFFKQKTTLDDEDKSVFADIQEPNRSSPKTSIKSASKSKPSPKATVSSSTNVLLLNESDARIPESPPSPPPKSIPITSKIMKKIAKYVRNTTNGQPIETLKAMNSNKLSKNSFQFLIEFSPDILIDIWTRMEELWHKGVDENNIPSKGITNDDRQIIRAYLQIVNNIGSKESVAELIESKKKLPKFESHSKLSEKYKSIFTNLQHGGIGENNYEFLMEKFEAASNYFPTDELSKESYIRSMVYEDEIDEVDESTSVFNESSRNYSTDCILDSKYMSQWGDSMNQTRNSSYIKQSPIKDNKSNISNSNEQILPTPIVPPPAAASANDSDDDVVFVGTTHQSTPIRTGTFKQSLLNFSETPITSSATKHASKRSKPLTRRSQKNILDFVKSNKVQNTELASTKMDTAKLRNKVDFLKANKVQNTEDVLDTPKMSGQSTRKLDYFKSNRVQNTEGVLALKFPVETTNKIPEPKEDNSMNFFDDQFDDIIAANSGIFERIENSNQVNINSERTPNTAPRPTSLRVSLGDKVDKPATITPATNIDKSPGHSVKIPSTLGSDDSTPDDVIPSIDVPRGKLTNKQSAAESTPVGIYSFSKHSKQDKNIYPESRNCDDVHPELADIDINDLSEFSMDDIIESVKTDPVVMSTQLPHRASPDIFDELCESIVEPKVKEKSPPRNVKTPPAQASPCLLTKKTLTWGQIRQKYIKPSQSESSTTEATASHKQTDQVRNTQQKHAIKEVDSPNESVIKMPSKIGLKRRIIKSDSESSDDKDSSQVRKRQSRILGNQEIIGRRLMKDPHFRQRRNNEFIDDEAVLSGSESEDEFEHTIGQYIQDSVVVDDEEAENESSVPMTQVYLQSVRSPCGNRRGGFKIPERRQYNDASKIFSQRVPEEIGSYVTDSFVVVSDDESDNEKSLCPLERAEEILKMQKRAKRKAKEDAIQEEFVRPAKKKRVLRIHNSSEDDDDFA